MGAEQQDAGDWKSVCRHRDLRISWEMQDLLLRAGEISGSACVCYKSQVRSQVSSALKAHSQPASEQARTQLCYQTAKSGALLGWVQYRFDKSLSVYH